jgi:hypothetical protein
LTRTNRVDLHPVIAGIYGDLVFHLGAGTRAAVFRSDTATAWSFRLTNPLARIPVGHGRLRSWKKQTVAQLRRHTAAGIVAANQQAGLAARDWLLRDPDGLIAHLRGEPGTDTVDPTDE